MANGLCCLIFTSLLFDFHITCLDGQVEILEIYYIYLQIHTLVLISGGQMKLNLGFTYPDGQVDVNS